MIPTILKNLDIWYSLILKNDFETKENSCKLIKSFNSVSIKKKKKVQLCQALKFLIQKITNK